MRNHLFHSYLVVFWWKEASFGYCSSLECKVQRKALCEIFLITFKGIRTAIKAALTPKNGITPFFYVAFQIIGKYLLFINCSISNSYTYSRVYGDF